MYKFLDIFSHKSKLSVNDILSLARERGYFNLLDIYYAILENNGQLSIMPVARQTPTVLKDLNLNKIEKSSLPYYVIIDGKISFSTLNELNKNEEWLNKKLNLQKNKRIKDIILAIYDDKNDNLVINFKHDN